MLRREVWEKREVENVRDGEGVVGAGTFVYSVYCVEFSGDFLLRAWERATREVRLGLGFEVSWRRGRRGVGRLLEDIPSGVSKARPKRQASSLHNETRMLWVLKVLLDLTISSSWSLSFNCRN